jgi:hypothetical protein
MPPQGQADMAVVGDDLAARCHRPQCGRWFIYFGDRLFGPVRRREQRQRLIA